MIIKRIVTLALLGAALTTGAQAAHAGPPVGRHLADVYLHEPRGSNN
jgi:hypothetical protein